MSLAGKWDKHLNVSGRPNLTSRANKSWSSKSYSGHQPYHIETRVNVWFLKLSNVEPCQYLDAWPLAFTGCCKLGCRVELWITARDWKSQSRFPFQSGSLSSPMCNYLCERCESTSSPSYMLISKIGINKYLLFSI